MRIQFIAAFIALPILAHVIGCTSSSKPADANPYDSLQACYDDHHGMEGFPPQRAIEICCIDHPIGGAAANTVCGETAAACKTYVGANLTDAADPTLTSDISSACDGYILDRAG